MIQKKVSNVFYDLNHIGFDENFDSSDKSEEAVEIKEVKFNEMDKKVSKYDLEKEALEKLNDY